MAKMALGSRLSVFLVACVIFILTVFYASDEIVKNNGKDDSLNMMDVFRQKGKGHHQNRFSISFWTEMDSN